MLSVRTFTLLVAVAGVASAQASFEMMLIPGNDGRIHRYDPQNQVMLGSFRGVQGSNLVTANSAANRAYVHGEIPVTMRGYNYSTGDLVAVRNQSANSYASFATDTRLVTLQTSGVVRVLSQSSLLQERAWTFSSGVLWQSITVSGTTAIGVGTRTSNNELVYQTGDILSGLTSALVPSGGLAGSSRIGTAATLRNSLTSSNTLAFSFLDVSSVVRLGYVSLNANGTLTSGATSAAILSGYITSRFMPSVVAGHESFYVYGQDAAASTSRITQFEFTGTPTSSGSWTFAAPGGEIALQGAYQPSIVVAPEPGTMAALGVGVYALLRRRRK